MTKPPEKSRHAMQLNVNIGNRLQRIARMLEKELRKAGADRGDAQFSLLVWGPDRVQYVSNAERGDVKIAMHELLKKWDKPGADLGKPKPPLGGLH